MAKLTKESFIESLKEMTLLEIKELVDAMKEEFGVDLQQNNDRRYSFARDK